MSELELVEELESARGSGLESMWELSWARELAPQ